MEMSLEQDLVKLRIFLQDADYRSNLDFVFEKIMTIDRIDTVRITNDREPNSGTIWVPITSIL